MRQRFKIPTGRQLCVSAKPNNRIVKIADKSELFSTPVYRYEFFAGVRRRYLKDENEPAVLEKKVINVITKSYRETLALQRRKIDTILQDVYVVIPKYHDCNVGDIIFVIQKMQGEDNDTIAVEICKKLNV